MAETPKRPSESNTPKAVKDRQCPFCHQPFTSSSLGRHLDLFIKDKNPKAPDGIHDVEAIRKLRRNITRRHPKGTIPRRETSISTGTTTPTTESRKSPASGDTGLSATRTPLPRGERARVFPFNTPWEATGVINDLVPSREGSRDAKDDRVDRELRPINRRALKQQLDARQQLQDAQDSSRAAELALREVLGSFRAAKQQIDVDSMPFDFDPFSLDFPALTLQCLEPPPTLFASTQHPTPTSWSILPPGQTQLAALHAYFDDEFRRWKIACAFATTAVIEELIYPPPLHASRIDTRSEVRKAEKAAEKMQGLVYDHLEATYAMWSGLSDEQRDQLWRLELARSLGRKRKEVDKLKEGQHLLRQEVANLKSQIEQLSRLQQPREFNIAAPSTLFFDKKTMDSVLEYGVTGKFKPVGFNLTDRHSDLNTLVSAAIGRWKDVIVSARSAASGIQTRRPLNTTEPAESDPGSATTSQDRQQQQVQQQEQNAPRQPLPNRHNTRTSQSSSTITVAAHNTSYPSSLSSPPTAVTPRVTTVPAATHLETSPETSDENEDENEDEEMSDADADGDADGDTDMDDHDSRDNHYNGTRQQLHPDISIPAQQMGQFQTGRVRQGVDDVDGSAGFYGGVGGMGQRNGGAYGHMPSCV